MSSQKWTGKETGRLRVMVSREYNIECTDCGLIDATTRSRAYAEQLAKDHRSTHRAGRGAS